MNSRRLITALLAAFAVSAVCTIFLARKIAPKSGAHIEVRHYVSATRPLAPGEIVRADALGSIDWPAKQPLAGAYVKASDVVGRSLLYPVQAGQPIIDQDLGDASGFGLTARIPPGLRAIALKSDDIVGVGGFLYPSSHVDVLVTYRTDKSPETMTATVLQDVQVLATDHQTKPDPDGKPATVNVVTLLLTPDEAERVVLASTQGTIHFVLRNGSDRDKVVDAPVQMSEFGAAPAATLPAREVAMHTAPAARPPRYTVETITGDKATKAEF